MTTIGGISHIYVSKKLGFTILVFRLIKLKYLTEEVETPDPDLEDEDEDSDPELRELEGKLSKGSEHALS